MVHQLICRDDKSDYVKNITELEQEAIEALDNLNYFENEWPAALK